MKHDIELTDDHPKQGLYLDISNNEYHHTEKFTMLSSGGIRTLLGKSPSHLKATFESTEESKNPNFIFGSATHSYILEPDKKNVFIEPDVDKRTKEGKELYAKFKKIIEKKKNAIVINSELMDIIKNMKEILFENKMLSELLGGGKSEVTGVWDDPIYNFKCKLRNDYWQEDLNLIIDYKTAIDASLEAFSKAVFNYGYHIQAQWYKTGMKIITGVAHDFIFVVQEKTPPYSVAIYNASMEMSEIAEIQIKKAKQIYNDCLKENKWPGYPKDIQQIIIPSWIRSNL